MCSAHAVQIKLESRRILEKAFAEYPVRPDVVLCCYRALIITSKILHSYARCLTLIRYNQEWWVKKFFDGMALSLPFQH